ncbi:MAG TPA: hypothetical protein VMF12_09935 [Xanthobacteraceae bacterium]|nr:hypothetical protein [Xanthobacteraceae bacterium]
MSAQCHSRRFTEEAAAVTAQTVSHWVFLAAAAGLAGSFISLQAVEERPLHGPLRIAAGGDAK